MNRKSVVVTGAAKGIGRATVNRFSHAGWFVVGLDRLPEPATSCADRYIQTDIGDIHDLESAFAIISDELEGIDGLVNNAAIQIVKNFNSLSREDWDRTIAVNLTAPFVCAKLSLELLKKRKGAIVNIGSVHSVATTAQMLPYAVSKGGLSALTRAMALDLADFSIRVNTVAPGAVETDMLLSGFSRGHVSGSPQEALESFMKKQVLGRVASPKDIAEAVWFLANAEFSSFITGSTLVVDGGATVKLSGE